MNLNGKYKTLAKDTGLFAVSSFGSKILVFLLTPLYTYVLLPEEYGIADLITTTVNFIYPILTFAMADASLRFALDKEKSKTTVFDISMSFTFVSSILLTMLFPLIALINPTIKKYYIFFVAIYFLFNVHNTLSNFIKGLEKTKEFAIQGIVHTLSIITSNIIFLLFFRLGLEGYLLSLIIGYIVPVAYIIVSAKIYRYILPFVIDKATLKEMLKYSLPIIPTILAWAINTSIDKYMITYFIGLEASGIYSVAHKIPSLLTTVLSVFIQAWQISAINNYGSSDEDDYYSSVYKVLDFTCIIGCMVIIPLSKFFSILLFDPAYISAWHYVPMLTLSAMFSSLSGFLAAAFRAYKKTNGLFVSVLIGAVLNIVLNYILLKTVGTIGAAYATAICFFVVWIVRMISVQRIVRIKIQKGITTANYILLFIVSAAFANEYNSSILIYIVALIFIIGFNFKTILIVMSQLQNRFSGTL